MNNRFSISFVAAALVFFASCKPNESTAPSSSSAAGGKSSAVSAEKNSFNEVTAKLDQGGSLYLYLSTEQWLGGLSEKISSWRGMLDAIPDTSSSDRKNIGKVFDVVTSLVKNSGVEEISGVGLSSIAHEAGIYYSKMIAHHYKGQNAGYLWSLFGKAPHALDGLDLLPEKTALAWFSDFDLPQLWSLVQKEVSQAGNPEIDQKLQQLPMAFQMVSGMKFDEMLASLSGEYGIIVTLDTDKKITFPVGKQSLEFPDPGLAIVIKVKNDLIFNRVDQMLKDNPQVVRVDKSDLKMRTMPVPLPLPIQLRPTLARMGDYLILASSDALVEELVAVKTGKKKGWKSSEQFKKLSRGVPQQGNSFFLASEKLGETIGQLQKQALANLPQEAGIRSTWLANMFANQKPSFSLTVSANTDSGWEITGNGSESLSRAVLLPVAAGTVGLMAAIAIPNFVKARETAQKNACINNLRQLDGATQQWALENRKSADDTVTAKDVTPYLRNFPVCPAGGTYTLGQVKDTPKCSHNGHVLP